MSDRTTCGAAVKDETCEACGAEFRCEPQGSCWCFSETVPQETLEALKDRYQRCLCPACLRKAVTAV